MAIDIRIGLPLVGGALPAAARALGAPVLVSANAFARYRGHGEGREFAGFRASAPDLDGLDVALDSAGFVAHARYGGFPWSPEAYVQLAASRPWAWWAQMDACCEAEIAGSRGIVRLRQAETIRLLGVCERLARDAGIAPPMPVLQGRTVEDYVWHVRQLGARLDGAALVGVGSMCRRHVAGPDGLLAVVDALDRVLPPGVRLHLFGVKSSGLAALAAHHRVASVDSMAWDSGARYANKFASRTMSVRTVAMRAWHGAQVSAVASPAPFQGALLDIGEPEGIDPAYAAWGELLAAGEIDLESAAYHASWESCHGTG